MQYISLFKIKRKPKTNPLPTTPCLLGHSFHSWSLWMNGCSHGLLMRLSWHCSLQWVRKCVNLHITMSHAWEAMNKSKFPFTFQIFTFELVAHQKQTINQKKTTYFWPVVIIPKALYMLFRTSVTFRHELPNQGELAALSQHLGLWPSVHHFFYCCRKGKC